MRKALTRAKQRELHESLRHILSPLEQAVLKENYKPFVYNYNGIGLYISRKAAGQLMDYARHKIEFVTTLVERERLSTGIPLKQREAFDNPRLILALPPRLRNRLIRLGCYTLFAVMQKGRGYFEEQGFSPPVIRRLEGLFGEYGCEGLF